MPRYKQTKQGKHPDKDCKPKKTVAQFLRLNIFSKLCRCHSDVLEDPKPAKASRPTSKYEKRTSAPTNKTQRERPRSVSKNRFDSRRMSPMQRFGDPVISKRYNHKAFHGPWHTNMSKALKAENFVTSVDVHTCTVKKDDSSRQLNQLWKEDPGSKSSVFSSLLLIENSCH